MKKVHKDRGFKEFSQIVYGRNVYRFTDCMHEENPKLIKQLSAGHAYDLSSNIFERIPEVFSKNVGERSGCYICVYGRQNNERVVRYIKREYIKDVENLDKWKVYISNINGRGVLGEVLSAPFIGKPGTCATETFISIGALDTKEEAESVLRYIKTKFARAMLGTLKITHHNSKATWANVPLQDFTSHSDIDWSQSVAGIDRQLYKKYGLSPEEISFIESKVKEMK